MTARPRSPSAARVSNRCLFCSAMCPGMVVLALADTPLACQGLFRDVVRVDRLRRGRVFPDTATKLDLSNEPSLRLYLSRRADRAIGGPSLRDRAACRRQKYVVGLSCSSLMGWPKIARRTAGGTPEGDF
jgi:hypothetical protein